MHGEWPVRGEPPLVRRSILRPGSGIVGRSRESELDVVARQLTNHSGQIAPQVICLVITVIPRSIASLAIGVDVGNDPPLVDLFPLEYLDLSTPGVTYVSSKRVLASEVGQHQLYWDRSHGHWTPYSHELAGRALARAIIDHGLLE